MKHVRVRLTAGGREGEIHPMFDVLANAPFVDRATALQWNFVGDELGILHYIEGDIGAFETTIIDIDPVLDYELEPAGDRAFYAYIHDAVPGPFEEFTPTTGALVIVPPISYHEDGTVTLSLFGPSEQIRPFVGSISGPVDVEIDEVSGLAALATASETLLSERQHEAAETALDLGYYEVPRTASHEDVADAIGCAPSTAAEHLRKAESKLLHSVLGR
jgi:hypothetical protein